MRFSFILLAGGNSDRFKSNIPKPYHKIGGKTLLEMSLNKIRKFDDFKKIIIVCNKKHLKFLKEINLKNITIIQGGKTRQESTFNALKYLQKQKINNENIAIRNDGINVNKVNREIYLKLVLEPIFFFFIRKYKLELFLTTINKNTTSKITSKLNKICKSIFKKDNSLGLMKVKKVSIQSPIQIIERKRTNLKPFNFLNIKISIIYINII